MNIKTFLKLPNHILTMIEKNSKNDNKLSGDNLVCKVALEFLEVGLISILGGIIGFFYGQLTSPEIAPFSTLEYTIFGSMGGYTIAYLRARNHIKQYMK